MGAHPKYCGSKDRHSLQVEVSDMAISNEKYEIPTPLLLITCGLSRGASESVMVDTEQRNGTARTLPGKITAKELHIQQPAAVARAVSRSRAGRRGRDWFWSCCCMDAMSERAAFEAYAAVKGVHELGVWAARDGEGLLL